MNANNKKFRMVALDLDGTLLNSNHELSDATIAHLRRLNAKGFVVAIATGRSAACAAHIIEKLNLSPIQQTYLVGNGDSKEGFPLVCTNGARGLKIRKSQSDIGGVACHKAPHRSNTVPLDSTNNSTNNEDNQTPTNPFLRRTLIINEELFHNPLSTSLTLQTLALANRLGCVTNYYHNHHIYAVVRNEEQMELTRRYGRLTGSIELYCYLNDGSGENGEQSKAVYNEENAYGYQQAMELGPPSKLLILCNTQKLDEITNLVRKELNGSCNNALSNDNADGTQQQQQRANVIRGTPPFFVEVLSATVHKGHGLLQLCESLSIPLEEVIAFGDGDNDLEFVQMAGWGVAMKNARDILKGVADEIAEWSNDEVSLRLYMFLPFTGGMFVLTMR